MTAKCAVNIALLDIAAQRVQTPLCDFLGLGFHEGRHVTSFSIGIGSLIETRENVLFARDYPVLKLKVGNGNDTVSLNRLREIAPEKSDSGGR